MFTIESFTRYITDTKFMMNFFGYDTICMQVKLYSLNINKAKTETIVC